MNEENPLEYFKNLNGDPPDYIMSIDDMEKTISFHEEDMAREDKIVEGTANYPNYGDDFADVVYISRRLLNEVKKLQAERDEAQRLVCELAVEYKAEMFCPNGTIIPKSQKALAKAYGWNCFGE